MTHQPAMVAAPGSARARTATVTAAARAGPGSFARAAPGVHGLIARAPCACGGGCPACRAGGSPLRISQPQDPAEREADQIANTILRAPDALAPARPDIRIDMRLTPALQRDEEEPPPGTPVTDPRLVLPDFFDPRLDWFEMSRPFATRGADLLSIGDTRTHFAVGNLWQNNYRFFFDFGLSDKLSADAANFVTPFALDSALKRDFPTPSELFERNADITSFVISPTVLTFDLGDIPGTLRSPLSVIFGGDKDNPYRKKPRHTLGRQADAPATSPGLAADDGMERQVARAVGTAGTALPASTLAFFNARFGRDFSGVRIHTDSDAAASARAVQARAYTVGRDIVFAPGQFQPHRREGMRLLAHELTHVVQQSPDTLYRSETDASTPLKLPPKEGTMQSDPGIEGQEFTKENCHGLEGCSVGFKFLEAAKGTHGIPNSISPASFFGVRVLIAGRIIGDCGACQSLEMLQVVRYIERNPSGRVVSGKPNESYRRQRAGSSDLSARSAGYMVDVGESDKNPFYTQGSWGRPGSATQPAIIYDQPGTFPSDRDHGKQFDTYLICMNGNSRVVLGFVHWGYWVDENGVVDFWPKAPQAWCGFTGTLFDATNRWDKIPGNEAAGLGMDLPKR